MTKGNPLRLTDPEAARLRLTNKDRAPRGYCNVAKADSQNGEEAVKKSDVKVRSVIDHKYAQGARVWLIAGWATGGRGDRYEDAIGALHRLEQLRQGGSAVPDHVMVELAVEAIYDAGWDGPPW